VAAASPRPDEGLVLAMDLGLPQQTGIDLAVPGRPIRSPAAEDRSAKASATARDRKPAALPDTCGSNSDRGAPTRRR
jgi:hypothetical protein